MTSVVADLNAYLAERHQLQGLAPIAASTPISSGWESILDRLELVDGTTAILRRYPGEGAQRKCLAETQGLRMLYDLGYPVPRVLISEPSSEPMGRPFLVLEYVPGPLLMDAWPRRDAAGQQALLEMFCGLLARLHALDWRALSSTNDALVERHQAGDRLALLDKELDHLATNMSRASVSGFDPAMDWLRSRRAEVPTSQPAILHWDYHPQNIILREPDDTPVVIDWTQVRIGDPRFDLAWTLMLAKSHVGDRLYEPFLAGYQAAAGEVQGIEWFLAFCAIKRLYTVSVMLNLDPTRLGMRSASVEMIHELMPAFRVVYAMLQDITGLDIPAVEMLLSRKDDP